MQGTKFQLKVWKYLKTIPKGKVKTYKQVAIGIKSPKSARAVANACAKNPYAPKIPCHRVIRSDGALGGYSGRGGIKQKLKLLRSEKVDYLAFKIYFRAFLHLKSQQNQRFLIFLIDLL